MQTDINCGSVLVHAVIDAGEARSVHSEIDSIVDSAFSNMLQSAENAAAQDIASKQKEFEKKAAFSHSHLSDNERQLRESREGGPRSNFQKEGHKLADTEQRRQDTKLKGDETDDDMSLKQWKEQRRKMDLHKQSLHHKTTGAPSGGISEKDLPRPHHRESIAGDDMSISKGGSVHERVVTRSETEPEDVGDGHSDSVDVDLDEDDVQGLHEASGSTGSSDEARDRNHTDPDLPESTGIENATNADDDADLADSQNVRNEQSLRTDNGEKLILSETTAADVAGESKEGVPMSDEELVVEETFEEDSDREAEDVPELTEIWHKSSEDDDEDERSTDLTSEAGSVEENTDTDVDDDGGHDDDAEVDEATNTESDLTEEHSDLAMGSSDENEDLPQNEDEEISPVNVDDSDLADIVVPDDGNTGWTFSPLSSIYSFIETIIDMVRCITSCTCS